MPPLSLAVPNQPDTPEHHLSVDGMSPVGPNLSHWPGNRTPSRWKADLSTGICMNFARATAAEQNEFLAGATAVLNDHYDTDGFLSLLTILQPEVALAHEELCLLAAATGDFQAFQTWRGFAIDRIVLNLAQPWSPFANQFAGLQGQPKNLARYRWLLDHGTSILQNPQDFAPLFETELEQVTTQLREARRGGIQRQVLPDLGLSILTSTDSFDRIVLNSMAGAYRVLHIQHCEGGHLYRYHDRTESWFELATIHPPRRRDLQPLADHLNQALSRLQPAGENEVAWTADSNREPVPELYFGVPAPQAYGQVTRQLSPCPLPPEQVVAAFTDFFTGGS